MQIKAHFDGRVLIPDEPLKVARNEPLILKISKAKKRRSQKKINLGFLKEKIWVSPDFDDPLPDEFWLGEE